MGINYLALNDLFQISSQRKDIISYEIHVQMVEIYNEQVRDLLAEDSSTTKYPFILAFLHHCKIYITGWNVFNEVGKWITDFFTFFPLTKHKLEIRSCTGDNGLSLPDATMRSVKSTTDVLNLIKLGEVNRFVSSTAMNNCSSRSHRSNSL